jgi:DNA-binding transcriptional LysR family regulator
MRDTARSSIAPFQRNETSALVSIGLKHLRYAEVAERCGSFRKAADLLAIKQSNLSRRVRQLEEQLGIALFERTNGGVRPTPAGRGFINGARRVLIELQIVIDGAKAVGRGDAGYLTIGFYTSLSAGNLRASLVEYGRLFPQGRDRHGRRVAEAFVRWNSEHHDRPEGRKSPRFSYNSFRVRRRASPA